MVVLKTPKILGAPYFPQRVMELVQPLGFLCLGVSEHLLLELAFGPSIQKDVRCLRHSFSLFYRPEVSALTWRYLPLYRAFPSAVQLWKQRDTDLKMFGNSARGRSVAVYWIGKPWETRNPMIYHNWLVVLEHFFIFHKIWNNPN